MPSNPNNSGPLEIFQNESWDRMVSSLPPRTALQARGENDRGAI